MIPLSRMISECRLVVIGCRDQAVILRKRDATALADRATDRAAVFEATLKTLEWLDKHQDSIRAAVAARSTADE